MNEWVCADSFIHLPRLATKSFDCILADPPYDLSMHKIHWLHSEFRRICRGVIIIFAPPENQWVPGADQHLFWVKPISTKNTSLHYSRFVEMIFIYGRLRWNNKRHWSQYTNVFTDLVDDTNGHQFRKPPSLIRRLLLNHTNEGDYILDPFAGSGVVGDVCAELNRNCLSIEIEPRQAK